MDILVKLINKEPITDRDIEMALYDICDTEHASCSSNCPVFDKIGGFSWREEEDGCGCFKNGRKMLKLLRKDTQHG